MSTILDSSSVFNERSRVLGLSEESIASLIEAGIDTVNKLAFCSSFRVGNPDDSQLVAALNKARTDKLGANHDAAQGPCTLR